MNEHENDNSVRLLGFIERLEYPMELAEEPSWIVCALSVKEADDLLPALRRAYELLYEEDQR